MANRIRIPYLIDIVMVSNAEEIKKIEASKDVGKISSFKADKLPWWVRLYIKAISFYDFERKAWVCPFHSKSDLSNIKQIDYLEQEVAKGYSPQDVVHVSKLLREEANDKTITNALFQLVNKRLFETKARGTVVHENQYALQSVEDENAKYGSTTRSPSNIFIDSDQNLRDKSLSFFLSNDNIKEAVLSTTTALKTLKENLDMDVEDIFTQNPLKQQVARIAIKSSNINGLLKTNTKAAETLFLYEIGKAAQETGNLNFAFGTGTSEKACIFKNLFLSFMKDVQKELMQNWVPAD